VIEGYVNEYGQTIIKIKVKGTKAEVEVEAQIDTGFDGEICLPIPIAIQLGLELSGDLWIELADGTRKKELIFIGSIIWECKEKEVKIILTNFQQTLIGTGLFQGKILEIDFVKKGVEIREG